MSQNWITEMNRCTGPVDPRVRIEALERELAEDAMTASIMFQEATERAEKFEALHASTVEALAHATMARQSAEAENAALKAVLQKILDAHPGWRLWIDNAISAAKETP